MANFEHTKFGLCTKKKKKRNGVSKLQIEVVIARMAAVTVRIEQQLTNYFTCLLKYFSFLHPNGGNVVLTRITTGEVD